MADRLNDTLDTQLSLHIKSAPVNIHGARNKTKKSVEDAISVGDLTYDDGVLQLGTAIRSDLNTEESNITNIRGILDHYAKTGSFQSESLSVLVNNYPETLELITKLRVNPGLGIPESRGIVAEVLQEV